MGARPLKRVIQNEVEDQLSDKVLAGEFQTGDHIILDAEEEEIVLRKDHVEAAEEEETEPLPAG